MNAWTLIEAVRARGREFVRTGERWRVRRHAGGAPLVAAELAELALQRDAVWSLLAIEARWVGRPWRSEEDDAIALDLMVIAIREAAELADRVDEAAIERMDAACGERDMLALWRACQSLVAAAADAAAVGREAVPA